MTELVIRNRNGGQKLVMKGSAQENLIMELCEALDQYSVRYCHWKSNANVEKSLSGDGDLDLLVHKQDAQIFNHILMALGFKEVDVPDFRRIPGIRDYYGYDDSLPMFVHVHAHFQLTVGHDATKRIRLNIEDHYLDSVRMIGPIKVPAVEYEYIVFVMRMVLKHLTWDAFLRMESRFSQNERFELDWMKKRISDDLVNEILSEDFPFIRNKDFHDCAALLAKRKPGLAHIQTGQRLANQLEMCSRMNVWVSLWRKLVYRFGEAYRHRIIKKTTGKRLVSGGMFIAIVGGDGSGKTTLLDSLHPWLHEVFDTMRIHLGKPRWSFLTYIVRGCLKILRLLGSRPFLEAPLVYTEDITKIKFPGYPWAIRELCTARDRYLTFRKGCRFASNGGIVISDRFPLQDIHFMDGAQIERMAVNLKRNRVINRLIDLENKYYRNIRRPDLMIVLKVDPTISSQRKIDEEPEDVKARGSEIWIHEWNQPNVHVIDASSSREEVLREVKTLVWSYL